MCVGLLLLLKLFRFWQHVGVCVILFRSPHGLGCGRLVCAGLFSCPFVLVVSRRCGVRLALVVVWLLGALPFVVLIVVHHVCDLLGCVGRCAAQACGDRVRWCVVSDQSHGAMLAAPGKLWDSMVELPV